VAKYKLNAKEREIGRSDPQAQDDWKSQAKELDHESDLITTATNMLDSRAINPGGLGWSPEAAALSSSALDSSADLVKMASELGHPENTEPRALNELKKYPNTQVRAFANDPRNSAMVRGWAHRTRELEKFPAAKNTSDIGASDILGVLQSEFTIDQKLSILHGHRNANVRAFVGDSNNAALLNTVADYHSNHGKYNAELRERYNAFIHE
jgi:hypothetical protein